MQRVTVTLDEDLVAELDRMIEQRGYQNRSEALRDLARAGLRQAAEETHEEGECVGALVYVYDHEARQLAKRLTHEFHEHHDLSLATLHVHLDHHSCMEINVLRGEAHEVRHLAEHVIAERGVKHGRLLTIPVSIESGRHPHGEDAKQHLHTHVRDA